MSPDASSVPAAPEPLAVDAQHPWLGLASFTEETRGYFYGREEEVAELCRRVQRKLLTILFGQSGLGKTSILRAGIVPRLRPEGYCPVYVRIDYSRESPPPSEQIKQAIYRATQVSGEWSQPGVAVAGESLWEFLHHREDVLRDASGRTLIPLLIFDQFEEIFTLAQTDDFGRQRAAQFLEDLADLVENRAPKALEARIEEDETAGERFDFARSDYRILIALREDYLAHLEGVKGIMPSITQNRMRLARMTGDQALAAVLKPGGKLVSEEVAEAIVRFVAGGAELRNAEVEPSLLSLICRELNTARIAQGRAEISADLLAGSRDTILAEFYERALADQPAGVRKFIEDAMLTESGFRESLAEERVRKAFVAVGAPEDTLAKLVDRRLLRIEERLDLRRVELTHDVLCGVVKASRDLRLEREARDEAEQQLQAQREREAATRRALIRARQIAAGCAVLAVVALGSAIYGYISTKRAQEAELKALQTRQMAETARGEAEKLIVYLLDDFYLELEPVGRLDIVGDLSKRALDYYAALPAELRTAETDRNRALALVRYGAVLRTQSKLDESEKALGEAVDVLARLRKAGDESEATAIGLGIGLVVQARVLSSRNRDADSRQPAQQAVDVLKPLAVAPDASVRVRRATGGALVFQGFAKTKNNDEEGAIENLELARQLFRSIDNLSLGDLPAAAAYAEASSWQVGALQSVGRQADALRVGEEAMRVAGQVLEKRPGHMQALRARGLAAESLAGTYYDALDPRRTVELARQAARDWETMVTLDPTNQIAWNNLASARMTTAFGLWNMGRIRDSIAQWRQAVGVEANAKVTGFIANPLSLAAGYLAMFEADAGNRQAAEAALADNRRLSEIAIQNIPPQSFARATVLEFNRFYGFPTTGTGFGAYALPYAAADYEGIRTLARASIRRLEQAKPDDAQQELDRSRMLEVGYRSLAEASYALRDYTGAKAAIDRALEIGKTIPRRRLGELLDASENAILAAMISARLGNDAEAQRMIGPVVKYHRDLHARRHEAALQHLQYAKALFASALATPGRKAADLGEAARILDALPPELRGQISVALWRNRITEEQQR